MQLRLKNLPPNMSKIYTEEIKIAEEARSGPRNGTLLARHADTPHQHGIGMAIHTWGAPGVLTTTSRSVSPATARCWLNAQQDLGTGERTLLAIVVAEILGLEVKDITVRIGESQFGRSTGSGGHHRSRHVARRH